MYTWRESVDMCSIKCKHWSYDMDDSFCAHPKAMELSRGFGLSENAMIRQGLCTGAFDDSAKNLRQLYEIREIKEKQ